ncbi:hypothetical protein K440DRAFT_637968 [Wilcoxina mikolae CBS 423.85]|nr:hypothetical protein K440DRAFT_637968 [Wilcoxina mikolae CBS 423.85]
MLSSNANPSTQLIQVDYINVLVVVLGPREDARKSLNKSDYYIQDASSLIVNGHRRKTVLSVWRDHDAFKAVAKPGSIVAIYGAANNKSYEEDVIKRILSVQTTKVPHGHLNIYKTGPGGWFVFEPGEKIEGYKDLVEWRDSVWRQERKDEEEELERKRKKEAEEKERERKEHEAAEKERIREMDESERIGEEEKKRRQKLREEKEDEDILRMEKDGMVWWRDGKPFWRIDGLY